MTGGIAPTTEPISVLYLDICFIGVYTTLPKNKQAQRSDHDAFDDGR